MMQIQNYQPLNSKSQFPWLWIGTWSLGGEGFGSVDLRESKHVLAHAFESGVRHFDTAGIYAHGKSEALLSEVFKSNRNEIFISSKGGLRWQGNNVIHAADIQSLREDLYNSLERLKTDYIDLFQLHWPDPKVDISESLEALKMFKNEGLIRFWGAGNLKSSELQKYIQPNENILHQVRFNPIHQDLETLRSAKIENRCLNCVISPLEQGLLGSSLSSQGLSALGKRDLRHRNSYFRDSEVRSQIIRFREEAQEKGLSPALSAFQWILNHSEVDAIIPGPKTLMQLKETLKVPGLVSRLGHLTDLQ